MKIDFALGALLVVFIIGVLLWLTALQMQTDRLKASSLAISTVSETLLCKKMQGKIYLCRRLGDHDS